MTDATRGSVGPRDGTLREERRPVTAVFADLVGSTALAEGLDPAEVKLVVGEAVARIVIEVERLGGFVKDLAGDGVLAFFGAPVASEDDPERALLAAIAVAQSIAGYAAEVERGWGIAGFGVRLGITTGPVVVGALGAGDRVEYAAFGDTVNTAARLQGMARPGQILVDDATWRLVAPQFAWEPPVVLELKGRTAPVRAHALVRAHPSAGKTRGLAGIDTPLVGRDAERGRITASLEALRDGRGGLVLILGEAGIGKSRLIAEARARHEGPWLEGRCVSYGESLPYWPFRDLVRDWLGAAVDDPELRVRVSLRRAVGDLFGDRALEFHPYLCAMLGLTPEPDAAARLADLSPEALRFRTFEVIEALVLRIAAERPVVIQLDDLHWADPTSLQLVERLLTVGERAAVLLVIAQRDDRDHGSWRIREAASREVPHLLTEIGLEPLSGDAERAMLTAVVGDGVLPVPVERAVLDAAEGNPFYLEELVRSMEDQGALVRDAHGWRFDHAVAVEVPPTVERVVLARIDRLSATRRDVLTAASALGRVFSLPLLEAVLGDADAAAASLHELQRLDLLRTTRRWPQPELRFKHALIQDAAYRTLLPDRRADLHRRAATWLETRYEGAEQEVLGLLAHHWLEAGDEEKAIAFLSRAADQARQEWSLDEAIDHYRRLLPLLERREGAQAVALTLFRLALALHQALRFREANETYARAFAAWSPPEAATHRDAVLRVGQISLPDDVDPVNSHRIVNIQLTMALFDRLVEAWPDRTIVPSLAERWEIADDGLRYVFHLRPGLRWSDGAPLTAHDVEHAIRRALDREHPAPSVAILFVIEGARDHLFGVHDDPARIGVRALDDLAVEFRLAVPAPYFMALLNRSDCAPRPRHAVEAHGPDWVAPGRQVVSGAFQRTEHGRERIVLERRPASPMARTGNVQQVELQAVDGATVTPAYLRDELDIVNSQFEYLPELAAAAPDDVVLDPPAYLVHLALRHTHPAVGQHAFRLALAHAIDRAEIARMAPPNAIVATGGIVPPPLQGHTPDIAPAFDPDRARAELRRSGVDTGVSIVTLAGQRQHVGDVIERVATGWEDVLGLRFPVVAVAPADFVEQAAAAPIAFAGWFPGYPDPEYYLRLLLHSDALDNVGRYRSERYDALIEQARAEQDGRTRLALFHEADRFAVADDVATIPLLYVRNMIMVKPWVRGWWEYGKAWSSFADLVVGPRHGA